MNLYKLFLFLCFILLIPSVYADDNKGAKSLGWASIGIGLLANVPFILYNRIRKMPVNIIGQSVVREMALLYKPILNFHIILNIISYILGSLHGIIFIEYLDPISLSLAIVINILVISGLLLRYTSSRDLKLFNKLMHGQVLLVLLLIVLIILHISTADD